MQETERDSYFSLTSPIKPSAAGVAGDDPRAAEYPRTPFTGQPEKGTDRTSVPLAFTPNRRISDTDQSAEVTLTELTEQNLRRLNRQASNVNPIVHSYTSPIGAS